jgi:hypothetical protein
MAAEWTSYLATEQTNEANTLTVHEESSSARLEIELGDVSGEDIYYSFNCLDAYGDELVENPPCVKETEDVPVRSDIDLMSLDTLLPTVQELTDCWQLPSPEIPLEYPEPNHCQTDNDTVLGQQDCRKRFKVCF